MINVIKEIMFDCAYENVVQTEITFEEKVYNLNIFKHREVESHDIYCVTNFRITIGCTGQL